MHVQMFAKLIENIVMLCTCKCSLNSWKSLSSHARANVRITYEKRKKKIPIRTSHGLKWETKAI